jgi:hypothetical protein
MILILMYCTNFAAKLQETHNRTNELWEVNQPMINIRRERVDASLVGWKGNLDELVL